MDTENILSVGKTNAQLDTRVKALSNKLDALSQLNSDNIQVSNETSDMKKIIINMDNQNSSITRLNQTFNENEENLSNTKAELETVLKEMKVCPTCGNNI